MRQNDWLFDRFDHSLDEFEVNPVKAFIKIAFIVLLFNLIFWGVLAGIVIGLVALIL